jgi:hypothetical protein
MNRSWRGQSGAGRCGKLERVIHYPPLPLRVVEAMAMRLPRMTTRRWMIAVAAVGLLMGGCIGGYRLKRWYDHFLDHARVHAFLEVASRRAEHAERELSEKITGSGSGPKTQRAVCLRKILYFSRIASYHAAMARKYQHAADRPWLPVEPDPPPPES